MQKNREGESRSPRSRRGNTSETAPAAAATGFGGSALESVCGEAVALYHRLRWEAEQIHGQGQRSSGRRGVLRGLAFRGPKTVPQMARERPVSRQYIQSLVNGLAGEGLVEFVDNPAHRRSSLVRLTRVGEDLVAAMNRREQKLFSNVKTNIEEKRLRAAVAVLRAVRELFEGEQWRQQVNRIEKLPLRGKKQSSNKETT